MSGTFINKLGYDLVKLPCTNPAKYDFTLDENLPLTYMPDDGRKLQPNRHFVTDMGSIPRAFQVLFPKDRFLLSYMLHDSGYTFGGYWQNGKFIKFTRRQVDDLLYDMILAEGGSHLEAFIIWSAVRMFGASAWNKGDIRKR